MSSLFKNKILNDRLSDVIMEVLFHNCYCISSNLDQSINLDYNLIRTSYDIQYYSVKYSFVNMNLLFFSEV